MLNSLILKEGDTMWHKDDARMDDSTYKVNYIFKGALKEKNALYESGPYRFGNRKEK